MAQLRQSKAVVKDSELDLALSLCAPNAQAQPETKLQFSCINATVSVYVWVCVHFLSQKHKTQKTLEQLKSSYFDTKVMYDKGGAERR